MLGNIVCQKADSDCLSVIAESDREREVTTQRSHIDHLVTVPKKGMNGRQSERARNIVSVRSTGDLSTFVDVARKGLSIGPTQSPKVFHLSVLPKEGPGLRGV